MRANLIASSVAALALASGGANAQTVISRSISAQPVETTVTQTPTGTIVTRRPVEGQVVQPVASPLVALVAPGLPRAAVIESDTVDTVTTGAAVQRAQAAAAPAMTTRQVSQTRPVSSRRAAAHQSARRTTRTTTTTTRAAPRLALDRHERHIVYRTIVEREVVPRQQVVVAPSVAPTYALPRIVTAPQPPIVAADDDIEVVAPAGSITVGTVLPANVPLYAIPENVTLSVPATQPYSYAYLGGRAYLVEPASGTVVADVTE